MESRKITEGICVRGTSGDADAREQTCGDGAGHRKGRAAGRHIPMCKGSIAVRNRCVTQGLKPSALGRCGGGGTGWEREEGVSRGRESVCMLWLVHGDVWQRFNTAL